GRLGAGAAGVADRRGRLRLGLPGGRARVRPAGGPGGERAEERHGGLVRAPRSFPFRPGWSGTTSPCDKIRGMERLRNAVRAYAWGSRTAIASLQGRPVPSPGPEAELWVGAHPGDPSRLERDGTPLTEVIAAAPEATLGAEVVARYGPRLPY